MESSKHDNTAELVGALFVLGAVAIGGWYLLGQERQFVLKFVLWHGNKGALLTTLATAFASILAIVLLAKKTKKTLSSEIGSARAEFQEKLTFKLRLKLYIPYIITTLILLITYFILYSTGVTKWFWFDFLATKNMLHVRGLLALATAILPFVLLPFYAVVFVNATGLARSWKASVLSNKTLKNASIKLLPDPGDYQKNTDWPAFLLGAREYPSELEPNAKIPSWIYYSAPTIFNGMIIFGQKGSGKTSWIKRMILDAIRYPSKSDPKFNEKKPALMIIDDKGDISNFVEEVSKVFGREEDIIRLGVDTFHKWNPLASLNPKSTASDCRRIGFFLRCAMTTGESSEHAYWQNNTDNLLFRSSHLLALSGERVSFDTIYKLITSMTDADISYRQTLYYKAKALLEIRENAGESVLDWCSELDDTKRYFESEFVKIDNEQKMIIVNNTSNFLQKFLTTEYKRSFCCPLETRGHFGGFQNLIAEGKIFVLDIRSNHHGTIANPLRMLAKLFYQAAVKTRDLNPNDKMRRATVSIMDEFQGYLTPSSSNTEGDDKYLETSRSFKAIDIAATQQYTSIKAAVGGEMAQRIIGSFNSIVVYKHNDPALTDYIQKIRGQERRIEKSININESSSKASIDLIRTDSNTEEDHQISHGVSLTNKLENIIDATIFWELSEFEAIGFFDEPRGKRMVRFCTKPEFVPLRAPHEAILNRKFGKYWTALDRWKDDESRKKESV